MTIIIRSDQETRKQFSDNVIKDILNEEKNKKWFQPLIQNDIGISLLQV